MNLSMNINMNINKQKTQIWKCVKKGNINTNIELRMNTCRYGYKQLKTEKNVIKEKYEREYQYGYRYSNAYNCKYTYPYEHEYRSKHTTEYDYINRNANRIRHEKWIQI